MNDRAKNAPLYEDAEPNQAPDGGGPLHEDSPFGRTELALGDLDFQLQTADPVDLDASLRATFRALRTMHARLFALECERDELRRLAADHARAEKRDDFAVGVLAGLLSWGADGISGPRPAYTPADAAAIAYDYAAVACEERARRLDRDAEQRAAELLRSRGVR